MALGRWGVALVALALLLGARDGASFLCAPAFSSSFVKRGLGLCGRGLEGAAGGVQLAQGNFRLGGEAARGPGPLMSGTGTFSRENLRPLKERRVMVAGASGRVGKLVVKQILLRQPTWKVVAAVRDLERAETALADVIKNDRERVDLVLCNLEKKRDVEEAVRGVDQVIWCASGFSGRSSGRFQRLAFLLRVIRFAFWKQIGRALDLRGPMRMARALKKMNHISLYRVDGMTYKEPRPQSSRVRRDGDLPRLVMLSSAAVTRPKWNKELKTEFPEAANIPIVKLNPLGLLNAKLKGEDKMKKVGVPYSIVRSCGINSTHPDGHVVISYGDTAVGRVNPSDLARVLVTTLDTPQSTYKTFEVYTKPKTGFFDPKGVKGECERQLALVPQDAAPEKSKLRRLLKTTTPRPVPVQPIQVVDAQEKKKESAGKG